MENENLTVAPAGSTAPVAAPSPATTSSPRFTLASRDTQNGVLVYNTTLPDETAVRVRINGRRVRGTVSGAQVWFVDPELRSEFSQIGGPSLA